jgi:hypothetical protein
MNRNRQNIKDYKEIALKVSKDYINTSGLIGIIWIGSSSYEVNDDLVDIDILLICSDTDNAFTMRQFKKEQIKIEVNKTTSEWLLQKTEPDSEQFWIREKAIILYDPKNILKEEFRRLNKTEPEAYEKLLRRLYKDIFHSYDFEKSIKRKDKITAWMFVLKTIDTFSKFCFIYFKKPVTTFKWRWYFIVKEELLNNRIIEKIKSFNSKNSEENYHLLKDIEKKAQQMMLKKNYPSDFINKPWLF